MNEPVGEDDDVDPGLVADAATDHGHDVYFTLLPMHQTVLNLFTAGLYHLFEQQASSLYRWWSGATRGSVPALRDWLLSEVEIDVQNCPSWAKLRELRLVANVVKHAEGDSSDELRTISDADLFRLPSMRDPAFRSIPDFDGPIEAPLTGEDIYVTKADYDEYVAAVRSFLECLADSLDTACVLARS